MRRLRERKLPVALEEDSDCKNSRDDIDTGDWSGSDQGIEEVGPGLGTSTHQLKMLDMRSQ